MSGLMDQVQGQEGKDRLLSFLGTQWGLAVCVWQASASKYTIRAWVLDGVQR